MDFPEDDQNIHLSVLPIKSQRESKIYSGKDETKKTLLEYLSADTYRSKQNSDRKDTAITSDEKPAEQLNPTYQLNCNNRMKNSILNGFSDDDGDNFKIVKKFSEYDKISNFNKRSNLNIDRDPLNSNNSLNNQTTAKRTIVNLDDHKFEGSMNVSPNKFQSNVGNYNKNYYPTSMGKQISILERREAAAKCIHVWWRKAKIRRTAGAAAMRRMMENKQKQLETKLKMERQKVNSFSFLYLFVCVTVSVA